MLSTNFFDFIRMEKSHSLIGDFGVIFVSILVGFHEIDTRYSYSDNEFFCSYNIFSFKIKTKILVKKERKEDFPI